MRSRHLSSISTDTGRCPAAIARSITAALSAMKTPVCGSTRVRSATSVRSRYPSIRSSSGSVMCSTFTRFARTSVVDTAIGGDHVDQRVEGRLIQEPLLQPGLLHQQQVALRVRAELPTHFGLHVLWLSGPDRFGIDALGLLVSPTSWDERRGTGAHESDDHEDHDRDHEWAGSEQL